MLRKLLLVWGLGVLMAIVGGGGEVLVELGGKIEFLQFG